MSDSRLSHQLREYEQRLQNLGTLRGKPVRDRTLAVLGLLNHRENLHRTLNAVNTLPNPSLQHLLKLDARLKQNAGYIVRRLLNPNQLGTWREEILNRSDQWWWHLEDEIAAYKKDKVWWLPVIFIWGGDLSLAIGVGTRLFASGASIGGSLVTIIPILITILQLLVDGSIMSTQVSRVFWHLKPFRWIPSHWRARFQTGVAVLVFFYLLLWWNQGLPIVSRIYNNHGDRQFNQGDLRTAELSYEKAIEINPGNAQAHYNLGNLYEELNELEKAKFAYQIAVRSPDSSLVYNNLGRLYILEKDYSSAFSLFKNGLQSLDNPNQYHAHPDESSYTLHKNLGWLELEQKNHSAALNYLRKAISIAEKNEIDASSSYCLLAQLPSENPDPKAHLEYWQKCCQKEENDITKIQPEEYKWLQLARQHLEKEGKQCHALVPNVSF